MKHSLTILCMAMVAMCGCKEKEPQITKIYELSEEMMDFFVNYEVGTKWIYQDIIDSNNFDTIELISKENFDVIDGDIYQDAKATLKKGYELYYKPSKSKDFKVRVSPGVDNRYYVKVDPMVTAAGAITFENNNGVWTTGVTYYDSIEITGTKYYQVINSISNNMYQYDMKISKDNGIVFFIYSNVNPQNPDGAAYKLINTIKQ